MAEQVKQMKIKVTTEDILRGKFHATFEKLSGYILEGNQAQKANRSYSGAAVETRMEKVKELLQMELINLAEDIEI